MNTENQAGRLTLVPLVSKGLEVFLQNFRLMLPLGLIYLLFNFVTYCLFGTSYQKYDVIRSEGLGHMYISLLIEFVLMFLAVIPGMAIIKMVESAELGTPMNWQDALRYAYTRWGSSILTMLILMLILLGFMLLLFIPIIFATAIRFSSNGVDISAGFMQFLMLLILLVTFLSTLPALIWMIYYVFAFYIVALRNFSGKAALDYSKQLVKGQWWRVFGYTMVVGIGVLIVQIPVNLVVALLPLTLLVALIKAAVQSVITLLVTTVFTLYFLNLEAIKGGREVTAVTLEP